jgi:hypothetical protein
MSAILQFSERWGNLFGCLFGFGLRVEKGMSSRSAAGCFINGRLTGLPECKCLDTIAIMVEEQKQVPQCWVLAKDRVGLARQAIGIDLLGPLRLTQEFMNRAVGPLGKALFSVTLSE